MSMPSFSFHLLSFQRKVQDALQSVERTLELERKPCLAGDIDHTYGAKYSLVNLTSNAAIIAYMTCLERLGLDAYALKSVDKAKPTHHVAILNVKKVEVLEGDQSGCTRGETLGRK
jgi:hypothetical protein